MTTARVGGAILAQILGQALTSWTLVAHVTHWPEVSPLVMASLVAAAVVPFRHDGSLKDRAAGNFGASLLMSGFLVWELMGGGLDSIIGGGGPSLGLEATLMLSSTVLFTVAGALFWTLREGRADR